MDPKVIPDRLLYFLFLGAFFVMPFGTSPFTILGICILAVWVATGRFLKNRTQVLRARWLLPVAAIVILTWAGLLWSTDPGGLGLKYAKKTHYWLYALVLAGMGLSEKASENLTKALLLGLLLNAFVAFLQAAGIVPGSIVGMLCERSIEAIVCIMGVLKAGGAYLPIDPAYPPDRKNYIILLHEDHGEWCI